jgi:hypothetical protein
VNLTNLNNSDIEFNLKKVLICNKKGEILIDNKKTQNLDCESITAKNMIKQIYKEKDKITMNENGFSFEKIYFNELKLFYLASNDVIICGIFKENTKSYLIKIFLIHVLIAYFNFNCEFINFNRIDNKTGDLFSIRDVSTTNNNLTIKEILNLKVFEVKISFFIIIFRIIFSLL